MAKILVIDDSDFFREMCSRALSAQGFEVETATNGKEGVEKMNASPPQLVFLDLVMPEMNGEETLKQIQQYPNLKGVPIIMLTSISASLAGKDLLSAGPIVGYIKKEDTNPEELVKKAKEVLGTFEQRFDPMAAPVPAPAPASPVTAPQTPVPPTQPNPPVVPPPQPPVPPDPNATAL